MFPSNVYAIAMSTDAHVALCAVGVECGAASLPVCENKVKIILLLSLSKYIVGTVCRCCVNKSEKKKYVYIMIIVIRRQIVYSHREYESIEHEHVIALWDEYTVRSFVHSCFIFFSILLFIFQAVVAAMPADCGGSKQMKFTHVVDLCCEQNTPNAYCVAYVCMSYIRLNVWGNNNVRHAYSNRRLCGDRKAIVYQYELVSFGLKDIPMWANGAYYTCWDVE